MIKLISYTTLTVLTVDLLATAGDITLTWPSPVLTKLYSNDSSINPLGRPITKNEDAFLVSLINIGAMIGGIPFTPISERFGRKPGLLIVGLFHIVSYVMMAFAKNLYLFYAGRIIGGLAVGGGYTLLPMYIAEIAEEPKRGLYSTTLTIYWAVGNIVPYLVGPFVSIKIFNLINAIFPIAFCISFLFIGTETPFYLIGANKNEEAEKVLMKLRSKKSFEILSELKHIKETLEQEKEKPASLKDIVINRGLRKAFIISIILIMLQQLSGWNAITSYLEPIFEASGSSLPPYLSSMAVGGSILLFSLPVPYFSDKLNRKFLIISSAGIMSVCLFAFSVFFYLQNKIGSNIKYISWIPIVSLLITVFAFESGMACLPWTLSSELFPKNAKKLSASATSSFCWLASYIMTQFFNSMNESMGRAGTFLFYSVFCFITVIFTYFYIPETRGKTFIEIQNDLLK